MIGSPLWKKTTPCRREPPVPIPPAMTDQLNSAHESKWSSVMLKEKSWVGLLTMGRESSFARGFCFSELHCTGRACVLEFAPLAGGESSGKLSEMAPESVSVADAVGLAEYAGESFAEVSWSGPAHAVRANSRPQEQTAIMYLGIETRYVIALPPSFGGLLALWLGLDRMSPR